MALSYRDNLRVPATKLEEDSIESVSVAGRKSVDQHEDSDPHHSYGVELPPLKPLTTHTVGGISSAPISPTSPT